MVASVVYQELSVFFEISFQRLQSIHIQLAMKDVMRIEKRKSNKMKMLELKHKNTAL